MRKSGKRKYDADAIKAGTDLRTVIHLEKAKRAGKAMTGRCPFPDHPDRNPSFAVYRDGYKCFSCGRTGTLFDWLGFKHGLNPARKSDYVKILAIASGEKPTGPAPKRRKREEEVPAEEKRTIPVSTAERFHANLDHQHRVYYFNRGLSAHTVNRELLGWTGDKYVIPVWEGIPRESEVLQLRLRASRSDQIRYSGVAGFNLATVYNRQALLTDSTYVIVFFGEFDALLAFQFGLNAVSPTNGARSFKKEWVDTFFRKFTDVYVVPDKGEEEEGERIERFFGSRAHMVILPYHPHDEDGEGNPVKEKDFTDLVLAGWPPESFWDLVGSGQGVESYWDIQRRIVKDGVPL